jgi:hypothetical protein
VQGSNVTGTNALRIMGALFNIFLPESILLLSGFFLGCSYEYPMTLASESNIFLSIFTVDQIHSRFNHILTGQQFI